MLALGVYVLTSHIPGGRTPPEEDLRTAPLSEDELLGHPESQVMPAPGALYTVASIRPAGDGHSVRLKELAPSCHLGGPCGCGQCGWDAGRFRKVHRPRGGFIAELLETKAPELV